MPSGRYIISRDAVQEHNPVTIHDSEHLSESCNTDQIRHKSRFNDLEWALRLGYVPCQHCMSTASPIDAADATFPLASGYIVEEADADDAETPTV